jgi:hypothetical protein
MGRQCEAAHGGGRQQLRYPLRWPDRPQLKLNEFFYPTHASRWGEFNGVIDQAGYEAILTTCFPQSGTNPAPATFTLKQEDQDNNTFTFSTQMFCLPPRPLAVSDQTTGLFLITLVDQRYYLQFTDAGVVNPNVSWDTLLTNVAGNSASR